MKALALFLSILACGPAMADEAADLIQQLDSEKFVEREQAAEKLAALGQKAIPALTKSANEGPLETTVRSIEILKTLMASADKAVSQDAKAALEKLAESKNAGTSRRAKNALAPKPEPKTQVIGPGGIQLRVNGGGIAIANGRIVIQNNAQQIKMQNINGVKTVEVTEGQREVKIQDDPNKGITVEITEQNNGKKTTEKFEAKNEEELKKKHPKAHAEYEKYAKNNGNAAQIQIGGAALPLPVRQVLPFPARRQANGTRLEMARRILKSYGRHLENLADDNAIKDADNEARESLKKDLAEMKNRLSELEKKLQTAIDADKKDQPAAEDKPAPKAEEKPAE